MATIEQSIEVDVPVRTAYNQWTQFEEFPRFMEGVREVRQLDDRRLATAVTALLTGSVLIYAFGLPWLAHVADLGWQETFEQGLYPFVVGDLAKLYLAGALLPAAWGLVKRLRD